MKIKPLIISTFMIIVLVLGTIFLFVKFERAKNDVLNFQNQRLNDSIMILSYVKETDDIQKSLDSIIEMEETLKEDNLLKTNALKKVAVIKELLKNKLVTINALETKVKAKGSIFPVQYVERKRDDLAMLQNRYLELEIYINNLKEDRLELRVKLDSALKKVNNRSITVYNQKQTIENLEDDLESYKDKIKDKDKAIAQSKKVTQDLKAKTASYYFEIACNLKDDADKTWKLLNNERKKARTKLAYSLFAKAQELGSTKAKDKIKEIENDKVLSIYIK